MAELQRPDPHDARCSSNYGAFERLLSIAAIGELKRQVEIIKLAEIIKLLKKLFRLVRQIVCAEFNFSSYQAFLNLPNIPKRITQHLLPRDRLSSDFRKSRAHLAKRSLTGSQR